MANKRIKDLATTKYKGFMALDDADGTGKMDVDTIFNNFAGKFVPNSTTTLANAIYMYNGAMYIAKESGYQGEWDPTKFTSTNAMNYALGLSESFAQFFDPTRDASNPYKIDEFVSYEGKTYFFVVEHYGPWNSDHVHRFRIGDYLKELIEEYLNGRGILEIPFTASGIKAGKLFKQIKFYDSENLSAGRYRISALYRNSVDNTIRINVVYPTSQTISFVCPDPDPSATGVQTYVLTSDPEGKQVLEVTLDWDLYEGSLGNTQTFAAFYITEGYHNKYSFGSTLNRSWTSQNINYPCLMTPVRKVSKDGVLEQMCVNVDSSGEAEIVVGEVDQYLLFVERAKYPIDLVSGVNVLELKDRKICVYEGENIALRFKGKRKYYVENGLPDAETSYYFNNNASSQLALYGEPDKQIHFAFNFVIDTSESSLSLCRTSLNDDAVSSLRFSVADIQDSMNIFKDSNGKSYILEIRNGAAVPVMLDFSHIMFVGNSYTVHPTVEDTRPGLTTNRWWGHWSMAASTKAVAWTSMIEDVLSDKYEDSAVYPVLGRPYETGGSIDADASFVYWDSEGVVHDLFPNISNFSDTDCVVLFLGENYSGNDIETWYTALVNKFKMLFPNAMIYCCGSRTSSSKSAAIASVAATMNCRYISMQGVGATNKIGSYVEGDDGNLHQIADQAVANHPGDKGQLDIAAAMLAGLSISAELTHYNVTLSDTRLTVKNTTLPPGCIVSIFGEDSVTSISVNSGAVVVTPHLNTDYGNVFTFIMPSADVTVTVAMN